MTTIQCNKHCRLARGGKLVLEANDLEMLGDGRLFSLAALRQMVANELSSVANEALREVFAANRNVIPGVDLLEIGGEPRAPSHR